MPQTKQQPTQQETLVDNTTLDPRVKLLEARVVHLSIAVQQLVNALRSLKVTPSPLVNGAATVECGDMVLEIQQTLDNFAEIK